jgi:hypothetical protein
MFRGDNPLLTQGCQWTVLRSPAFIMKTQDIANRLVALCRE